MKFRFLSANKRRQRTARNFGCLLLLIGTLLLRQRIRGSDDLMFCGLLMLIWSTMSWFAYRVEPDKPISIWIHVCATVVFIFLVVICALIIANVREWFY